MKSSSNKKALIKAIAIVVTLAVADSLFRDVLDIIGNYAASDVTVQ